MCPDGDGRMAANVLRIALRELAAGAADDAAEEALFEALGLREGTLGERRRELSRRIRAGECNEGPARDGALAYARERACAASSPWPTPRLVDCRSSKKRPPSPSLANFGVEREVAVRAVQEVRVAQDPFEEVAGTLRDGAAGQVLGNSADVSKRWMSSRVKAWLLQPRDGARDDAAPARLGAFRFPT